MAKRGSQSTINNHEEPTREEKLSQLRGILKANISRSMRLQHAIMARGDGKPIRLAEEKDLKVLMELRVYAIKRDELSIQYEKDHAACVARQIQQRDTLEASARLQESRGVYGPPKLKSKWKHCPCVEAKQEDRSKAKAAGTRSRYKNKKSVAQKARLALSGLTHRFTSRKYRSRDEIRLCDASDWLPLKCGVCFECRRQSLRSSHDSEFDILYEDYCELAGEYFEETAEKIGDRHLTWWLPSRKPLRPDPGTSRTISPTDPVMISSSALDVPRRASKTMDSELEENIGIILRYVEQIEHDNIERARNVLREGLPVY